MVKVKRLTDIPLKIGPKAGSNTCLCQGSRAVPKATKVHTRRVEPKESSLHQQSSIGYDGGSIEKPKPCGIVIDFHKPRTSSYVNTHDLPVVSAVEK
jgi:hypothetical protein